MSDMHKSVAKVLEAYASVVYDEDLEAFTHLYEPKAAKGSSLGGTFSAESRS